MIILTIRTDKPEAEVGLYDSHEQLQYKVWEAHRQLAESLHTELAELLRSASKDWTDVAGIVVYRGPGSFTGLRIGLSVANALAYALPCPIAATTDDWIKTGIDRLILGQTDTVALPEYGAPVHITQQKK